MTVSSIDLSRIDPFDPEEPYQALYREAIEAAGGGQSDSLQKRMRYFILYQAARTACCAAPDLDMVECGCYRGHSTYMLARLLRDTGFRGQLHVFDSFEGLSAFSEPDASPYYETETQQAAVRQQFRADPEQVGALLRPFAFVRLYPGWIPTRFAEIADRRISFLSLDVDLYKPTLESLRYFFPRMTPGGAVYLDDYGYRTFPGARKAADEYFADTPPSHLLRMPFGSALAIK